MSLNALKWNAKDVLSEMKADWKCTQQGHTFITGVIALQRSLYTLLHLTNFIAVVPLHIQTINLQTRTFCALEKWNTYIFCVYI